MSRIGDIGKGRFFAVRTTLDKQFATFIRKQRGEMPYRDFARKLGISKSSLARLEMGEESITLKRLNQVLNRLKCHSYRLYGSDINPTVIKATLVNGYLYAPWLVRPFPFLDPHNCDPAASQSVSDSIIQQACPEQLATTEHDADEQCRVEPIKKRRPRYTQAVLI